MSTKHYFVYGHTAKGFWNLFHTNIQPLTKVFILLGGSSIGKLGFMNKIGEKLEELTESVEYIHSPSDPDSLDGVLFPKLGIGVVDGTYPHVIEPLAPGTIEEYINLEMSLDADELAAHTQEILELQMDINECYEKAYAAFAKALKVHDEWEQIYIKNMDFQKADQLTEEVIHEILEPIVLDKTSSIKHRFFGGSTPNGPVDFVEDITRNISSRYFIKGRPGSGKSTMLKKILEKARSNGIDAEVYHCGFDPDSLDMLLFPELNLCIFDSTAPHEYYPTRIGDSVIDMYAKLINSGTDEAYEEELTEIIARYKAFNKEGINHLAAAKRNLVELEKIYTEATDTKIMEKLYDDFLREIMNLSIDKIVL